MKFGNVLQNLLEERELTQSELAEKIGYTQRAISKWVNMQAEPTEAAIRKVADYFNVPIDYLLGRTDEFGQIINSEAAPKITPLELDLIENFRKLPAQTQDYVVGIVKNLAR